MILERIVANRKHELAAEKAAMPLAEVQARVADAPPVNNLAAALRAPGTSLIAEVKKASPSRGLLCTGFDPLRLAMTYTREGAAAISVLTEGRFFQGHRRYLSVIRQSLGTTCPPLLRKDFLFDPYQIWQARADGADAVLLIAAILGDGQLGDLIVLARELGMAALVEVHDEAEVERALMAGAETVGINNRNLRDFTVDLTTTQKLRALIPPAITVVSESGIRTADDIRRLATWGVDAALVGEALVTASDVSAQVRAFVRAGLP